MNGTGQAFFGMFARYNRWANARIYAAAAGLDPEHLAADRGAYFRSVLGTLNHLLVVDRLWMARMEGYSPGPTQLDQILHADLFTLTQARLAEDARILAFVESLDAKNPAAPLHYKTTAGVAKSQPLAEVLWHFFNHQTHHRGQAHDLICQFAGRDATPSLDLLLYQREVAES